jgi:hypothetical protein
LKNFFIGFFQEKTKSENVLSTLKLELEQLIKEKESVEDTNQELKAENQELEKAKSKYKNQLLMLKFEKQKIQEQFVEVGIDHILSCAQI